MGSGAQADLVRGRGAHAVPPNPSTSYSLLVPSSWAKRACLLGPDISKAPFAPGHAPPSPPPEAWGPGPTAAIFPGRVRTWQPFDTKHAPWSR